MKEKLLSGGELFTAHFYQYITRCAVSLLVLCALHTAGMAQGPSCSAYGDGDAVNIQYTVNGSPVSDLNGVSSGDIVTVCFDLSAGSSPTIFTLVSYKAPANTFSAVDADLQTVFDMDSETVTGSGCLTVRVPSCYFQLDFVRGCAIMQLGPENTNNFYGPQARLIVGLNGGTGTCNCVAQADAGADLVLNCAAQATITGSTYTHSPVASWTALNGGVIISGGSALNATVGASGTYVLSVQDTLGCSATDTIVVTNGGPLAVDLGADVTICTGTTLVLDAGNTGAAFNWSNGAATQMISVTTSGTYSVTVTNGSCTATDQITVTVEPPVNVDLGADINVTTCAGSINLDAGNNGLSFIWNTGATSQGITVSSSGTYYVSVSDGTCSASDTVNVTFNPGTIILDLGADVTVCAGSTVMLDAENAGAAFSWSTGATTQVISVNTSGSFYVSVTDGMCTVTDTINVTVLPAFNVNLGGDISVSVCTGPVVVDAGNTGMAYVWNTAAVSQTINVTSSGMYYVTVSDTGGCSISDTINVTLTPPVINVDLGVDALVCAGGTLTLDAGNPGLSFAWNSGASTQSISVNTSGTYYVTVTDGSCVVSDTINVVVLPELIVDLGNDTTVVFCTGSLTLDAGNAGMTYLWNNGSVSQATAVTASGTYYVTVTNAGGCSTADTINVTVNPGTVNVNLGNDTAYLTCTHETLTLDAAVNGTYIWNTGLTTQTLNVSASGSYYVTVTDSLGCVASDTINVTITDNTIDLDLGNDTIVCGGCLTLSAAISGGTSYQWCSGQNYPMITVCNTGIYCVTVGNGTCMATDSIGVLINNAPVVNLGADTMLLIAGTFTVDADIAGMTYLWSTGETTQTISVNTTGSYYVTVTDMFGCTGTDTINVHIPIGIAEREGSALIVNVFPNPSSGSNLTMNFSVSQSSDVEIRIMNVLGRVLYSENLVNFKGVYNKQLPVEELSGGIYFANVKSGKTNTVSKFTVQK
ncbi:MAG TPA: T9SS type A sorting domain-containing protein [Bacteroidia bacterium]|jgi:hypothetical protein